MKLTKEALKQFINEEMDGQAVAYTVGKGTVKTDPWRDVPQTHEELYAAIQKASRILEDLPLEDLPEAVSDATQSLRDVLDIMPQTSEPSLTPGRADAYSYLNET
jgi:hypothetical protein